MNLIFDLDGTLIDSSDGVVDAINYSLRSVGAAEQPAEVLKPFIGYPLYQVYPHFTDVPFPELYRLFQERARDTVVQSTVALDGAAETLEQLHQLGYRMSIASTKIRPHIDGIVDLLGWHKYFIASVGGNEVVKPKPDPAAFRLALDRMQARANDSVVIGDTVNDIYAAKAIPMISIAVRSPYAPHEVVMASDPDHVIDTIGDLPELLAKVSLSRRAS